MFTKVLFVACALFVVAQATDIYVAAWSSDYVDATCTGTAKDSMKFTLDQCTKAQNNVYFKVSVSGSNSSVTTDTTVSAYATADTTCTTARITASWAVGTCVQPQGVNSTCCLNTMRVRRV